MTYSILRSYAEQID